MKIDKHIYFTNEEYARILDYKEKNKLSFSEAVCFLSISALNSNDILDRINFLESRLDYLIKKINIIYSLEEQIYSDMNFDNLFDETLQKYCLSYDLKKVKSTDFGTMFELTYIIKIKNEDHQKELLDEIREKNGNLMVSLSVRRFE